jgi:pimeloyl-ACP methyl ester carboxylesterase
MPVATLEQVNVDGLTLAYRELGAGPPVLLLHGWPTSSYLWRDVMPPLARTNRVVAVDLPAFGGSDKPLDVRYGFGFFLRILDGFADALELGPTALAVHDIGGPIGVRWALDRPGRVNAIAILNTLLYPEFDETILEFVKELATPELRARRTSPAGLTEVLRLGFADQSNATDETIAALIEPFAGEDAQIALAKAGIELSPNGFAEIAARLSTLDVPVRVIYGEQDRILPDVATTFGRLAHDLPRATPTVLPCGHFAPLEAGAEIGEMLSEFFAGH